MTCTRYFLGGNTAAGFCSFYHEFCAGPEDYLWVIKGGPGCGKSSFMKRVGRAAQEAGLDVEYVLCSGDPESVDGLYLPALHTGYVDGTAPHVQEVRLPGAGGAYLDLGRFYDRAALVQKRSALASLFAQYRAIYVRAYETLAVLRPAGSAQAVRGCARNRFLRAVTCRGVVCAAQEGIRVHTAAPEELPDLLSGRDAVCLRHPVFPELAEGVQTKDGIFLLPDTEQAALAPAVDLLAQAKRLHDELEALYNPHVDFAGVYALAQAHAKRLQEENPVVMREEM